MTQEVALQVGVNETSCSCMACTFRVCGALHAPDGLCVHALCIGTALWFAAGRCADSSLRTVGIDWRCGESACLVELKFAVQAAGDSILTRTSKANMACGRWSPIPAAALDPVAPLPLAWLVCCVDGCWRDCCCGC